ncbi:MAG: TIGR02302 family protein [Defluviicoccus sp.]|nr:TIGR02302 family protein [Defluviicoccus sp.]MDE0382702.1 TIGR02302 family protein [Defluviicoccus sp.]
MTRPSEPIASEPRPPRYGGKLLATRASMIWEQLWRGLWPALSVVVLFLALALFGVLPLLPGWLHALVLCALLGGFLVLLWTGLRGLAVPDSDTARRRLERASGFPHRPLETLEDRLADGVGGPDAAALWREHRARVARSARRIRLGLPRPGVASRDPMAIRFAAALLVVIAAVAAWPEPGKRLGEAVSPVLWDATPAAESILEVWIAPPDYTGEAPIFPKLPGAAPAAGDEVPAPGVAPSIRVPAGSVLTARLANAPDGAELVLGESRKPFERVDSGNASITAPIVETGRLAIEGGGRVLGDWQIEVVPDRPPSIAFAKPPGASERKSLTLVYKASDDYGLDRVRAEIRRTYERGTVIGKEVETLELALPRPGAKAAEVASYHDLTPHRWAGMPVAIRLVARDGAGQEAASEDARFTLPERVFRHPVARQVIEQRKRLTTEPERREAIAQALSAIAARPGAYQDRTATFLALTAAYHRLVYEPGDGALDGVRDLLWDTALGIEDGELSIAERNLRRAQQDLMEALARNAPDAELERLMDELQGALDRFLRELAQQMRNVPDRQQALPFDPSQRLLESTDLQRVLQQIRDLMRSGARDAARQMLAALQNMLENLRAGRMPQMSPQAQAGNQALQQLRELIERQKALMNRSFRQSQPQSGRPDPRSSRQGAMTQRELREALKRLREALRRMGMQPGGGLQSPGRAFDDADRNMGDSAGALDRNAPGDSVAPQGRAIDALQRAGQGIVQRMMQQMDRGTGIGLNRDFRPLQLRRDPLGRFLPNEMGIDTRDMDIPDESAIERAQRILEELRHRAGQRYRPQPELDYIDRLLRRF